VPHKLTQRANVTTRWVSSCVALTLHHHNRCTLPVINLVQHKYVQKTMICRNGQI